MVSLSDALQDFLIAALADIQDEDNLIGRELLEPYYWTIDDRNWNGFTLRKTSRPDYDTIADLAAGTIGLRPLVDRIVDATRESGWDEWILPDRDGTGVTSGAWERQYIQQTVAAPPLARLLREQCDATGAGDALERVVSEAVETLSSPDVTVVYVMPLVNFGIIATEYVVRPGLTLRKVTAAELQEWCNAGRHGFSPSTSPMPLKEILRLDAAIEARYVRRGGRDEAADHEAAEALDLVLTCLRLETDRDLYPAFSEYRFRNGLAPVRRIDHGYRVLFSKDPVTAGPVTIRRLRETWHVLSGRHPSRLDLPVRRWNDAAERGRDDDKLVDYWIALEALFVPEDHGTKKYLAAERMCVLLETHRPVREALWRQIVESYDCRSHIMHGQPVGKPRLHEQATRTREWLRRSIIDAAKIAKFNARDLKDRQLRDAMIQRQPECTAEASAGQTRGA